MPAKTRRPLDLTRKLARPIVLTGGPRSRLETLQDAAIPRAVPAARALWDRAAEVILNAAKTGKRADVAEATRQLLVALDAENWRKGAD
jgi:hypothetical protein